MRAVGLSQSKHNLVSVTATSEVQFTAKARVTAEARDQAAPFETTMDYALVAPGGAGLGIAAMGCEETALHARHYMPCA